MDSISIKDAALRIGCDHHYVRALIKQHVLEVDHTEPMSSGVEKVFITKLSVKMYMERRRVRTTIKLRVTSDEQRAIHRLLVSMRTLPDW
jgi:hypothetical protein